MKLLLTTRILLIAILAAPIALLAVDSVPVINPSFQADDFPTFPGYVSGPGNPAEITGWPGTGARGINGTDLGAGVPFADNGVLPDNTRQAFIQGAGSISQTISGFTVGDLYWVQGFANGRACCGDIPTVSVTIGATTLLPETPLPPKEAGGGRTQPYYFVNLPWTANATSAALTINSRATAGGDASVALDGISIIRRTSADVVIANPSFEASGLNFAFPGYTPNVAGWTRGGAGGNIAVNGTAANTSGNPFANNGAVPEGDDVVALQQAVTLSQTVSLLVGQRYRLSLDYNARANDPFLPDALFTIDGQTAFSGPVTPVDALGNFVNPYHHLDFEFTALNANALLALGNTHAGPDDNTLLFDNVRLIAVPEPSTAAWLGLWTLFAVSTRRRESGRAVPALWFWRTGGAGVVAKRDSGIGRLAPRHPGGMSGY